MSSTRVPRSLEELEPLFDKLLDANRRIGSDELAHDLLRRNFGIAEHLQGAYRFLWGSALKRLYLHPTTGAGGDACHRTVAFVQSRELAAEIHEDALRGLEPNALNCLEWLNLSEGNDARQLIGGVGAEDDARGIWPYTRDAHQVTEEFLLCGSSEAIEQVRIFAYDFGDEDFSLFLARESRIGSQGDGDGVAHTCALDEDGCGGKLRVYTTKVSDHL